MPAVSNVYLYGVEIWGLEEGWEGIDIIRGRFCKEVLSTPKFAANEVVDLVLGRDSVGGGQDIVLGCEILAKNIADGQGRISKSVL
jgi:hypothetical protein